jgi:hypothetical protein
MVRTEIIVTVGCDGGSLTIEGKHYGDIGWQFRMARNEMALYDDCVDDGGPGDIAGFLEHTDYLDSLGEALKLFDRYPYWPDLYIVEVHPEFVDEVLAEVRSRGGTSAVARWCEALGRKRSESGLMKEQAPANEEWERFKGNLAMCIADLSEDEFLIVSSKRANYFVQFASQGQFGMRIEATSNIYINLPEAVLSAETYSTMAVIGWRVPTAPPVSEPDPDGSPNFFVDLASPVDFRSVADLSVRTLRSAYGIQHPGELQYKAFTGTAEIRFPTLRINREPARA